MSIFVIDGYHWFYFCTFLNFITQIITLSDLECDYINARACCSKLNKVSDFDNTFNAQCIYISMWSGVQKTETTNLRLVFINQE